MLKKDTRIEKEIVYVFEEKSLAIMVPIGIETIEEDKELDTVILELSKESFNKLDTKLRKKVDEEAEEIRECLRLEEGYSFISLGNIESSNLKNDENNLKYIKNNYKKLNQLNENNIELININRFKENKERFNLVKFEGAREHHLLVIDLNKYSINKLLKELDKNKMEVSNNLQCVDEENLIDLLTREKKKIFISLAIDIFRGSLVPDEINLGKFEIFEGSCNYEEFNRFGICLEILNDQVIISVGDFNGEKIHLENLNEIADLKYVLMNYVDKFIKSTKVA